MTGKEFGEWLDTKGIDVGEAASYFGVSEGTIYKWRSTPGVPETKTNWVRERMAQYEPRQSRQHVPERVSLEITREEFADWNRAALLDGKIIYDWAIDVLNEAAAEQTGSGDASNPPKSLALVAEEGNAYRPPSPSGGAEAASDIETLPPRSAEETA